MTAQWTTVREELIGILIELLPSEEQILDAIERGVASVFSRQVLGDELLNAIADGTREALTEMK